jgi:tetratricopeptide (TPR) repeat protein
LTDRNPSDRGDDFIVKHGMDFVRADQHVQHNKHADAVQLLMELLSKPSNAYVRSVMWMNIAIISDKMGQPEEAIRAYDEAGVLERSYNGYASLEHKAVYYAKLNRIRESLEVLEALLRRTDLKEEDRVRLETNVNTLRKHI